MTRVRIKICGVTTPEDACFAADAGADTVGLNFYPQSPRYLAPAQAAEIVRALPAFTSSVGVFVGMRLRQACAVSFQLGLRGIQTYEHDLTEEDAFPFVHIPAFRIQDHSDLELVRVYIEQKKRQGRAPRAILIDSRVEGSLGGTGQVAPWSLLAAFDIGVPLILAGGLTAENVAEAIQIVRPWGVDVASGVESVPGRKDPIKVTRFIHAAREAAEKILPSQI